MGPQQAVEPPFEALAGGIRVVARLGQTQQQIGQMDGDAVAVRQ